MGFSNMFNIKVIYYNNNDTVDESPDRPVSPGFLSMVGRLTAHVGGAWLAVWTDRPKAGIAVVRDGVRCFFPIIGENEGEWSENVGGAVWWIDHPRKVG